VTQPDPTGSPTDAQREWVERQASVYSEVYAVQAAKRCGVQWAPWMGDWFTSWSPRNGNSNAEGTWDHWVDLAVRILQDPLTGIVRPDAQAAVRDLAPIGFYDESSRELTDEELALRFAPTGDADA
jgi:hypothetical protein